jgi:hypothetical protein
MIMVVWSVTPCGLLDSYVTLLKNSLPQSATLKTEAAGTSENLKSFKLRDITFQNTIITIFPAVRISHTYTLHY